MVRNLHIDLGGPEIGVPKKGLDHPNVDAFLDQQCRRGVPEPVCSQVGFDLEAL